MSMQTNETLARRFLFEHNQAGYMTSLDELTAPDCVFHEYVPGLPDAMPCTIYNQFIAGFRAAMPDIHNEVEDLIVCGDTVTVRWSGYGTHTGAALMGVPASGAPVLAHGIYILRFKDGKIVEVWNQWDGLNVMQQLGAIPA